MSVAIFAKNLLEAAASVVTTTPGGDAELTRRLYDRDQGELWSGDPELTAVRDIAPLPLAWNTPTVTYIDVDLGSSQAVEGWGLVNHNLAGITVTLYADDVTPPTTSRDSVAVTGANVLRTFAAVTKRYWRIGIPAMSVEPTIGEVMLGVPAVITDEPNFEDDGLRTLGNVRRDRSPAGKVWSTKRGAARGRLPWGWAAMSDASLALLRAAFTACDEGAKGVMVRDVAGVVRWVTWMTEVLDPQPVAGADGLSQVRAEFEDAPA